MCNGFLLDAAKRGPAVEERLFLDGSRLAYKMHAAQEQDWPINDSIQRAGILTHPPIQDQS